MRVWVERDVHTRVAVCKERRALLRRVARRREGVDEGALQVPRSRRGRNVRRLWRNGQEERIGSLGNRLEPRHGAVGNDARRVPSKLAGSVAHVSTSRHAVEWVFWRGRLCPARAA